MPTTDKAKQRGYFKKWYEKNKVAEGKRIRRRKQKLRTWLAEYKRGLRCSRCPESHPATLDFHHPNPRIKESHGGLTSKGWGIERMMKEIRKCVVLCSNCHRKEHFAG